MSVITDWSAEKAAAFTPENLTFQHSLHERPMFDDEGLARLLDRYPREKLGVFTMGEDPVAWTDLAPGRGRRYDRRPAAGSRQVRPHLAEPA
jgi:hypothetical protein